MPEPVDPKDDPGAEIARASSRYLGHGMALAGSVALFGWLGSRLGRWLGGEELLTFFGMLLGGAAGFYSMYLQLVVRPREEGEAADRRRDSAGNGKDPGASEGK